MSYYSSENTKNSSHTLVMRSAIITGLVLGIIIAWKFTPLSEYLTPERWLPIFQHIRASDWALLAATGIYVIATLAFCPRMVMTTVIAIVFAPLEAFGIIIVGSLISITAGFFVGKVFTARWLNGVVGTIADKFSVLLDKGGVVGVALIRLVPVVPFMMVNLALGMTTISFSKYILGSLIGIFPGTLVACFLGYSLLEFWQHPDVETLAYVGIAALLFTCIAIAAHFATRRRTYSVNLQYA